MVVSDVPIRQLVIAGIVTGAALTLTALDLLLILALALRGEL